MELLVQQAEQAAQAVAVTVVIDGQAQCLLLARLTEVVVVVVLVVVVKLVQQAVLASSSFPIKPQQAEFLALPLHLNGLAQQV